MPKQEHKLKYQLTGEGTISRSVVRGGMGITATTVNNLIEAALSREFFLLSNKGGDTPDDEFTGISLNDKWTAVSGSASAVDLLETGDVSKYEVNNGLLIQAGSSGSELVELRQDYTLPDGKSIVVAFCPTITSDASIDNNELQCGICLNDNDAAYDAGSYLAFLSDTQEGATRFVLYDGTTIIGSTAGGIGFAHQGSNLASTVFLRLVRSGLSYYAFYSNDGHAWMPMGIHIEAAAASNLWIFAASAAAFGTPIPIQTFHWIREGANTMDPWPWR